MGFFSNLEKGHGGVMTTEVLEDGSWEASVGPWCSGPSGVLCVWAET